MPAATPPPGVPRTQRGGVQTTQAEPKPSARPFCVYGIAAPPQTRIAVAPGNGDVGGGRGATRTVRRRIDRDPISAESLQLPARGRRSTTRNRVGETRVERNRAAPPRVGRATTTGVRRGAGRTTSAARQTAPARSGTGGGDSCACGPARATTSETSANTAVNVARIPYYLLRISYDFTRARGAQGAVQVVQSAIDLVRSQPQLGAELCGS